MEKTWHKAYKQLCGENKKYIKKMRQYLGSRNLNIIAYEEAITEIVHKALEAQKQNQRMTEVFGYDEEKYCDELAQVYKKQSIGEKLMGIGIVISLCIAFLLICEYICIVMQLEEDAIVQGIYIVIAAKSLAIVGLFGFAGAMGSIIGQRTVFKSRSYTIITGLIAALLCVVVEEIFSGAIGEVVLTINVLMVVSICIMIAVCLKILRKQIARRQMSQD